MAVAKCPPATWMDSPETRAARRSRLTVSLHESPGGSTPLRRCIFLTRTTHGAAPCAAKFRTVQHRPPIRMRAHAAPGGVRRNSRIPNRHTTAQRSTDLTRATPSPDRPLRVAHRLTELGHASLPKPSENHRPDCYGQERQDNQSPYGNRWDLRAFAQSASARSASLV